MDREGTNLNIFDRIEDLDISNESKIGESIKKAIELYLKHKPMMKIIEEGDEIRLVLKLTPKVSADLDIDLVHESNKVEIFDPNEYELKRKL